MQDHYTGNDDFQEIEELAHIDLVLDGNQNGHLENPNDPVARTPDDYRLAVVEYVGQGQEIHKAISHTETIREYHARVVAPNTPLARQTASARKHLGLDGEKTSAFDKAKRTLPQALPAVEAPLGTPVKGMPGEFHNGLYGYDIDEGESDWTEMRKEIAMMRSALLVATSSSCSGLYAFIAGTPAETPGEYKAKWHQCRGLFPRGIHISTASNSNEINRVRFVCHDPDAYLAETVTPMELDATADEAPTTAATRGEARPKPNSSAGKPGAQSATAGMMEDDWVRHAVTGENIPGFAARWNAIWNWNRPDLNRQSGSEYDLALANLLVKVEWEEDEIRRAMVERRRVAQRAGWEEVKEKDPSYYPRTIGKAIDAAAGKDSKNGAGKKADATEETTQGEDAAKRKRPSRREMAENQGWQWSRDGIAQNSLPNAKRSLQETGWAGRLAFNEWTQTLELDGKAKDISKFEAHMADSIEDKYFVLGYNPVRGRLREAALVTSRHYNPVLDRINAKVWDRTDRWGLLALHITREGPTALNTEIAALLVRGIVVRALEPGCQFDYGPVLRSVAEGVGKQTLLKILAAGGHSTGAAFSGLNWQKDIRDKLRNVSVLELAEFQSLPHKEQANLKSFATQMTTNERDSYGAMAVPEDIKAVLVLTTNEVAFLGAGENRRHPVLEIPEGKTINLKWVQANVHQLWAQAAAEYRGGMFKNELGATQVVLPERLWDAAKEASARYQAAGGLEAALEKILGLKTETFIPAKDIWNALPRPFARVSTGEFSDAMRQLGYEPDRGESPGRGRVRGWKQVWTKEEPK